jgi:uncharacterized pyridoxamine 5'-phosphate oxidase family protein
VVQADEVIFFTANTIKDLIKELIFSIAVKVCACTVDKKEIRRRRKVEDKKNLVEIKKKCEVCSLLILICYIFYTSVYVTS